MLSLNENEIISRFIQKMESDAKRIFNLIIKTKKSKIEKPESTEIFKKYQGGKSSTKVTVKLELVGWQSYSDNGLESFLKSILEDDDQFFPIVNLEVFDLSAKGRCEVTLIFDFVFTRIDLVEEEAFGDKITIGADKDNIIREIELKLSEIYTLLKKLK